MSTHYVVVESVTGGATEVGYVEVCNVTGSDVTFTLKSAAGGQYAAYTVTPNSDHFASSGNVFAHTNNQSTLVIVTCNDDTSASLRHVVITLPTSTARTVNVPKSTIAQATTIVFPSGNIGSGAHAMVTNSTAASITVYLRYGSLNNQVVSSTSVPAHGFAFIAITNNDASAILTCSTAFTAQLLAGQGLNPFIESYCVP